MTATSLKDGTGAQLTELFESLVRSIPETLSSLVGRDIDLRLGETIVQDPQDLTSGLPRHCAVARGAMDKQYAGKTLYTAFELPDAITMSGLLMMTPDEVVAARRGNEELEDGEEAAAFGELGNVLYSGFANLLREKLADIDVRMHDQVVVAPGSPAGPTFGEHRLVTCVFRIKVGEFPESVGLLAVDEETATNWNGGPLELVAPAEDAGADKGLSVTGAHRLEDEVLESIPAAPIRGVLAAYLVQGDMFRILRRSCRRVGLELRRHGRGEIPNPAAHRNQVVVIEVPASEDRRFDWCRRIKDLSDTTPVVLMLRHPSRQRVTQAFLSRADAILGFPCDEPQLSQKLDALVPDRPPTADPSGDE